MKKHTGQCHCGKNQYEVNDDAEFQFICYCKSCRLLSSGGHLCGMVFDESKFKKAEHTQTYSYPGGSGKPIILHFCPVCSTKLYGYATLYPGKVVIRANTLENANFKSQTALFPESAFPWDCAQSHLG